MSYPIQKAGSASDVTTKNQTQTEYGNILAQQLAVEAGLQTRVTYSSGGAGASSTLLITSKGNTLFTIEELKSVVANIVSNTATNAAQATALAAAASRKLGITVNLTNNISLSVARLPVMTGLNVWLDGSDPAGTGTAPANGSAVTTWADKSGNGNNTSSVIGTPTYSSTGGVLFNGSSYFNLPNGSIPFNNTSYTIYFVINFTNFSGNPGWFGAGAESGNQSLSIRHESSSIRIYWYGNDLSTTSTTLAGATFIFGTQYQTGGQRTAFINGTAAGSDTPAARSQPNTRNTIGRAIDSAYFTGSMREVIVFNTNHTTLERQQMEGYLANKWGLQSKLPTNHPNYGISPPLVLLTALTYSGSGTWNDSSGNDKNATLETGVIAKNAAGNGIVLNGSTSWTFPNVAAGNRWSASVWYKKTGTYGGAACILSQVIGVGINILIGYPLGNLAGGFYNNGWNLGTSIIITDGVWNNIQVTWDGANIRTYLNGSLLGTVASGVTAVDANTAYRIGRRWDNADFVTGEIGEVRIYDAPLGATDVLNLYNTTRATYL